MKITINGKVEEVESYLTAKEYVNGKDKFEIVEKIPKGYFVWNIGDWMGRNDIIPLCEPQHGTLPNGLFKIEPSTLKAIRLSFADVKLLREAAMHGAVDLTSTQRKLKNVRDEELKELLESALPIYESISE